MSNYYTEVLFYSTKFGLRREGERRCRNIFTPVDKSPLKDTTP